MTPKARFLLTPAAEAHATMLHSQQFAQVLDVAMLEMIDRMPRTPLQPGDRLAEANYYRLEGAKLFRAQLETIADKPQAEKPPKAGIEYRTT